MFPRLCPVGVGVGVLLLAAVRAASGAEFRVRTFAKVTGPAPASQTIAHGLGEPPRALVLWTVGKTPGAAASAGFHHAIGASDGVRSSRSAAIASQDGGTSRQASRRMADKALSIVRWGEVTLAEADLAAWDSSGFTLQWTTNDASAHAIHFLAIAGAEVSARVVRWTAPTTLGPRRVTGVGFRPAAVLHFYLGAYFVGAPPRSEAQGFFGLGTMDGGGGQWANQTISWDAGITFRLERAQTVGSSILMFNERGVTKDAAFSSMDPDGFTVSFTAGTNDASQVFSLALGGVRARTGSFDKTVGRAPADQVVGGVGFSPRAVLLSSHQDPVGASPRQHARLGLGMTDGSNHASTAYTDADGTRPTTRGVDRTNMAFVKLSTAGVVEAEASISTIAADGFGLRWTTNDSVPAQITYLALGSVAAPLPDASAPPDAAPAMDGPDAAAMDGPAASDGSTGPDLTRDAGGADMPADPADAPGGGGGADAGGASLASIELGVGCACQAGDRAAAPGGAPLMSVVLGLLSAAISRRPRRRQRGARSASTARGRF
jgi:hypothetical protein